MQKIKSLEAVRGLLALWVVIGHSVRLGGYDVTDSRLLSLICNPGMAVDIFIVLSGFVIMHVLSSADISYRNFMIRRFFRLAPLYFVVLLVSVLCFDLFTQIITALPWRSGSVANTLKIFQNTEHWYTEALLSHLVMLHGLIAFPDNEYAFVGQAWSVSVEWQFYLIAPLLYTLIRKEKYGILAVMAVMMCILRSVNYGGEGFILNQFHYFLVGILSFFLWRNCRLRPDLILLLGVVFVVLLYLFMKYWISMALWSLILSTLMVKNRQEIRLEPLQAFVRVMHIAPLQWLGKISYSVYMTHVLMVYACSFVLQHLGLTQNRPLFTLALVGGAVTTTLLLSWGSFWLIETPGLALGRRLSQPR